MAKTKKANSYKMDANTQKVIDCFKKICEIPRGSGNESGIREFIISWANENKYDNNVDEKGNVFVRIPATKGMENRPAIVLQGHMDMVCEKKPDVVHDFTKDPIKTVIEGEWIRAEGTTLGADDGIAIALAMVLAKDPSVKHPDLELLFTVDEERGLTGANGLGTGVLRGKYLINIDYQSEGVFTIGCAGGEDTHMALDLEYDEVPNDYTPFLIKLGGCTGGHSGENINCERANAIKVLARVLQNIAKVTDLRLINIKGGSARNAIPRDCKASFFAPVADKEAVEAMFEEMTLIVKKEFANTDPNISLELIQSFEPADRRAMLSWISTRALDFIRAVPHGVAANDIKLHVTETSSNLAIVEVKEGQLLIQTSQRSNILSRRNSITSRIESVARLAGAHFWSTGGYVPWQPNFDSNLVKQCLSIYKNLFGIEPKVATIHAGLECGIIGDKHPGMEMVSIGPNVLDIHSPAERLHLPSVGKVYAFLIVLMANLKD